MASSSRSPSSLPPAVEDVEYPNWAELPPELTSSILQRLGAIEILENAQKVCTSWRRVCKDPSMWRKIVMHEDLRLKDLETMCRQAVDRSQGGLLEIDIGDFCTDELLDYIAHSSSNLRSLKLENCYQITNEGLIEAVVKLPLLENFEVSFCDFSGESLKVVGQSCPNLKTLNLDRNGSYRHTPSDYDDEALAIAETMPGLRHLQLFNNRLTNVGLNAILDKCPNLEHLDLRRCFNLDICKDLEKRCSERIKVVRLPDDSSDHYPTDDLTETDSSDEDDYYCGSDDYYCGSDDYSSYEYFSDYDPSDHSAWL